MKVSKQIKLEMEVLKRKNDKGEAGYDFDDKYKSLVKDYQNAISTEEAEEKLAKIVRNARKNNEKGRFGQ